VSKSEKKQNNGFVSRLAGFFPGAIKMRLPVQVTVLSELNGNGHVAQAPMNRLMVAAVPNEVEPAENTVIEFGTSHEVLFASQLPLEFEDKVRLTNQDGSFDAEAKVVAVQFEGGNMAVAARFTGEVSNWIIKPA